MTYFISEGLGGQELDVGPSDGAATILEKGEVATQGYESEDVKILETPEERQPITEPPAEEPATREALAKTTAAGSMAPPEVASWDMPSSKVNFPTIEVSSAETIAAGVTTHMETVPAVTDSMG